MELEHETFRNAKVANLYKASVLKKVGVLKKGCPTQGATYSGRSPTSLLPWLQGFLAGPVGARTCPVSSCLQLHGPHGKPRASGCQPGHSPPPSLPQVAEIHRASKDGQLYDVGGDTSSCSTQAEPPEPAERDTLPTSQVYPVSGVLESAKPTAPRPLALAPPGNTALTLALPCSGAPAAPVSPARPPSLGLPSLAFPGPHGHTWTCQ